MRVDGSKFAHRDKMLWLSEVPTRMAERYADKAAIIFGDRITTYGDLERGSARLCALWTEAGYRPGDTIGYLGVNSDLFYFALFAAARGQFLLVPFNWRYPQPELAYVLGDARPKLLIYDRDLDERVKGAIASAGTSPELLFTEGDGPDSLRGVLAGPALPWPVLPIKDEAPLLQVYTSGTTGRPKGAVLSHAAISLGRHSDVENPRWKKWTAEEITLSPMPNFHTAGICFVQMALSVGATCVLTGDPSAKNLLRLILAYKVDHIFVVSTLIRLLLEEIKASGNPPPKIANIHYGAAPMSPALLTEAIEAFGSRFTQYYGMTEAAGSTHFLAPEEHDLKRPHLLRSLGLPLTGVSMEIRRPDGSPCDVNESGEIWIKSDMIMSGYANRPKETAEVLIDGWYRTGDGGRADAEGYLYLTDRIKDMIITGGENVYPVELENVLRLHPMINDVAVVGIDDEKWGQAVAAVLEVTPDFNLSFDDVRNFAKQNLAGYKCPRAVFITPALPRTPTAKIQRNAARGLVSTYRRLA